MGGDGARRLEKALFSALRSDDCELVHEVCITTWNVCLPLLQANLRSHIKRTLIGVANALSEVSSPLHELRAEIHLELAKCEVADDLLASAMMQLTDGLALDYNTTQEQRDAAGGLERPWDRHLKPLHNKLNLKMALYASPERAEDQVPWLALLLL